MALKEDWVGVDNTIPCPVCGSNRWCLIHRSGRKVICPRTPSPECYVNNGEKNYIHRITGQQATDVKKLIDKVPVYTHQNVNFDKLLDRCDKMTRISDIKRLCDSLGPYYKPMDAAMYRVVWDGKSWYMPMQDGADKLTGIQRRFPDGGKRFIKESRGGVFVPCGPVSDIVYITEGFSDTLASYSAGHYSIGRVSAKTCYEEAVRFVKTHPHIKQVHIVTDVDESGTGQQGAKTLFTILSGIKSLSTLDILQPGDYNDVRGMFNEKGQVEYQPYSV